MEYKLHPEAKARVCKAIAAGGTLKLAAELVDCTERAIYAAAKRDPEFEIQLKSSRGISEQNSLESIAEAAKKPTQWRAAYNRLRMLYPEKYARAPHTMPIKTVREAFDRLGEAVLSCIPDNKLSDKIVRRIDKVFRLACSGKLPKRRKPRRADYAPPEANGYSD